jgi:hypothetical protein
MNPLNFVRICVRYLKSLMKFDRSSRLISENPLSSPHPLVNTTGVL